MVVAEDISKKTLRKEVLLKRKHILNKEEKDKIITRKLLDNFYIKNSKNILVYLAKSEEVNTFLFINSLFKLRKHVYAPKIEGKIMNFYEITSLDDLILGKFNILEPTSDKLFKNQENSCMIVPGLLFDEDNNRLGYGGGYYDKYLYDNNIYKIGICYDFFKVEKLKVEKYDIKMNEVITER